MKVTSSLNSLNIKTILIGIFAIWLCYIGYIAIQPQHMSDFDAYYYGTKAAVQGLNPYSAASIAFLKGDDNLFHHFSYPVYMLAAFWPFTLFSVDVARGLFLALKLVATFSLFCLWMKSFTFKNKSDPWMLLILALGAFHGTVQTDILAANISIFEQLCLWTGFSFFIRGNLKLGMIGIVFAGLCKGPLILFLGVFLFKMDMKNFHAFLSGVALFISVQLATFFCFPGLSLKFMENPQVIDSTGFTNPSLLVWITFDAAPYLNRIFDLAINPTNLYKMVVFGLISFFGIIYLCLMKDQEKRYKIAFLALIYGLVLPRMKDYSFVLQIMPALFVMERLKTTARWVVLVLLSVSLWPYYHLFTQLMLVLMLIGVSAYSDGKFYPFLLKKKKGTKTI